MTKRWMSWLAVAAVAFGGAGFALGGVVMGAHADERTPVIAPIVPCAVPAPAVVAPTPAPVVAPAPAPIVSGELSIRRMQVTSGIDHREPVDHPSTFDESDERIYAFVDVANPSDAPRQLLVTFENGQRVAGLVTLDVPAHSARFRTWAFTRLSRQPGEWTAIVRAVDGEVLATVTFEIR